MSGLTSYLQREFARRCPDGWVCRREARLLAPDLERLLGYGSRADVVLEQADGSRRLWIEFEVSRADPVANHAKFAAAHLFQPQLRTDSFLAMISPHVTRGRRNLAVSVILLMRSIGMNAFQTALFPHLTGDEVSRLNHLNADVLDQTGPAVAPEIDRALAVSQAIQSIQGHHLHLAGDMTEVMLNLRQWNRDLGTSDGRSAWGRRTITYFVFDPFSENFAPSKFCAYVPLPTSVDLNPAHGSIGRPSVMTIAIYTMAEAAAKRLDGAKAQSHLTQGLAMTSRRIDANSQLGLSFRRWLEAHADSVSVHPQGPVALLPPSWFV